MSRLLAIAALLGALPVGEAAVSDQFEAVATIEVLPQQFGPVNEVLLERAVDLSDHQRRTVGRAIAEEAERAGYDPFLVLGIIDVESDFRRDVVSSADARGLMQIQPVTLGWLIMREQWAVTPEQVQADPALQIRLGVRYVRYLHDRFGNLDAALMAYNMGPTKFGIVSGEEHGLDAYWAYPRAVRRDMAALKARSVSPGTSMAIGTSGAKPLATADGLWGG
ncbi:MAG: lytic transglycosylase domain-containing protein [Archangiaceae bacterium]|nr:lytic transglycosylase domain-containing protein [Archangiaceae bacterium]